MSQYWLNWLTDITLTLTVAVVLAGGTWLTWRLVMLVIKAWDEDVD